MPLELQPVDTRRGPEQAFVNAQLTLRELFSETATDATFLVYGDERLTFAQTYRRAAAIAHGLVYDFGVKPGDRVAISMRNYPEWVQVFMAATSVGAIAVAFNALWQADEMEHGLRDSGSTVLFADQERLDLLAHVDPAVTRRVRVVAVRQVLGADGAEPLERVLQRAGDVAMPPATIKPDDPATIFYTSGSTGFPKGALSNHRQAVTATLTRELNDLTIEVMRGADPHQATSRRSVALLTVPLFHVTASHAVLLPCFRSQCALVSMRKWDPDEAAALIERERVDWLIAPPAITHDLVRVARTTERDLSSLKLVGGGGAARPPQQVRQIHDTLQSVAPGTGWGMTETNSIGTSISGRDYLERPESSGQCTPVMELRVVDDLGEPLPVGQDGELLVRGAGLFEGYWNRPDADAQSFVDGWFRTGDVARFDTDGFLFIVDRIKDLIIRGGENIGCGQVEAALALHPAVHEAAVYSVPDDRLGEEVGATVYVTEPVEEDDLRQFLRQHLAHFAIPRYLTITHDPLPRVASGKLFKRDLRAQAISRLG
jgi:long-chain acyl-CoA synthetase